MKGFVPFITSTKGSAIDEFLLLNHSAHDKRDGVNEDADKGAPAIRANEFVAGDTGEPRRDVVNGAEQREPDESVKRELLDPFAE